MQIIKRCMKSNVNCKDSNPNKLISREPLEAAHDDIKESN